MGFLDKILRKKKKEEEEQYNPSMDKLDTEDDNFIEEVKLEETTEHFEETEDKTYRYLKVIRIYGLSDVSLIQKELEQNNIIVADVSPLKNEDGTVSVELKRSVDQLRGIVRSLEGDIALLGERFIIVTPSKIKIWRRGTQHSSN